MNYAQLLVQIKRVLRVNRMTNRQNGEGIVLKRSEIGTKAKRNAVFQATLRQNEDYENPAFRALKTLGFSAMRTCDATVQSLQENHQHFTVAQTL